MIVVWETQYHRGQCFPNDGSDRAIPIKNPYKNECGLVWWVWRCVSSVWQGGFSKIHENAISEKEHDFENLCSHNGLLTNVYLALFIIV